MIPIYKFPSRLLSKSHISIVGTIPSRYLMQERGVSTRDCRIVLYAECIVIVIVSKHKRMLFRFFLDDTPT